MHWLVVLLSLATALLLALALLSLLLWLLEVEKSLKTNLGLLVRLEYRLEALVVVLVLGEALVGGVGLVMEQ